MVELIKYAEESGSVEDIENLSNCIQDLDLISKNFKTTRAQQRDASGLEEKSTEADPGLISNSVKMRANKLLTRLMNGALMQTWTRHACTHSHIH